MEFLTRRISICHVVDPTWNLVGRDNRVGRHSLILKPNLKGQNETFENITGQNENKSEH